MSQSILLPNLESSSEEYPLDFRLDAAGRLTTWDYQEILNHKVIEVVPCPNCGGAVLYLIAADDLRGTLIDWEL